METSLILIAVFTGVIALSNLVLLGGLAYLAVTVKKLVDTSVKPTIENVNTLVDKVEDRAERMMDIGEDAVRKVSGTVVATTELVGDTVTSPMIGLSSLFAGVSKAVQTWLRASAGS